MEDEVKTVEQTEAKVAAVEVTPAAPSGPRVPRRERWVDMPEEYGDAGFKVKMWVNYPNWLGAEIASDDQDKAKEALSKIVVQHNGWLDEDGVAYPSSSDPDFWDKIPNELAMSIIALIGQEIGKLPNSLIASRRR